MNALAVVSIYVVTNRAPYLKCDPSVSVYVAVVWIPDHPTGPDLREGLCQTMLLVTMDFPLPPWAGTVLVMVMIFGAFMYHFQWQKGRTF